MLNCVHCKKPIVEPEAPAEIGGLPIRTARSTCSARYGDNQPMHVVCWKEVFESEAIAYWNRQDEKNADIQTGLERFNKRYNKHG